MNCTILPLNLKLKREFVVAGGRESLKKNHLVILDDIGLGEAAGSVHHGASPEEIRRDLLRIGELVNEHSAVAIPELLSQNEGEVCPPALCAFSSAWHDLMSGQKGESLHECFGIPRPEAVTTSVTVSVGDMEAWDQFLREGFDCLKIKMSDDESWNLAAMGKMIQDHHSRYRIDANSGWDIETALRFIERAPSGRIELIEQPFPADDIESWKRLRSQASIPLFIDESIADGDDVKRAAEYVDGVNIKIQKSGRLETAVAAMKAARDSGLQIMIGCMIESSVGIASAYHLTGMADFVDLDGRLLIEDDPFTGLHYEKNVLKVAHGYGHGVSLA